MGPRTEHPIPVHRRREEGGLPVGDRALRRAVEGGGAIRVAAGCFARRVDWEGLRPVDRHLVRVLEATARARTQVVVSHVAAAAVWGIDLLGTWPEHVDVRIERSSGGRSSGIFRRRAWGLDGVATTAWNGHRVTTPAQTAIDLARMLSFTGGVVAADQALWRRRVGGALVDDDQLRETREQQTAARGDARVDRTLAFATPLSDSVRESQSRVVIAALGFPAPVLQHPVPLGDGTTAYPDFFFPDFAHAGEFDGAGKYLDPAMIRGRTPEEVLMAEKDRGDALRRRVRALSRWRVPALREPALLYDILVGDGLPSSRPRPRRGVVWR